MSPPPKVSPHRSRRHRSTLIAALISASLHAAVLGWLIVQHGAQEVHKPPRTLHINLQAPKRAAPPPAPEVAREPARTERIAAPRSASHKAAPSAGARRQNTLPVGVTPANHQTDSPAPADTEHPSLREWAGSATASASTPAAGSRPAEPIAQQLALETELLRHLERFKRYPRAALRAGIQGTVQVGLVLDSEGQIRNSSLVHSSGFAVLDHAALELLARAEPYPVHAALGAESLKLSLPVDYRLSTR